MDLPAAFLLAPSRERLRRAAVQVAPAAQAARLGAAIVDQGERFELIGNRGKPMLATRWGEGPVVALMRGWEGRGSQLGAFVQPLVERGFQVVAVDAPGHGDAPDGYANPVVFAETLQRLDHWVGGCTP